MVEESADEANKAPRKRTADSRPQLDSRGRDDRRLPVRLDRSDRHGQTREKELSKQTTTFLVIAHHLLDRDQDRCDLGADYFLRRHDPERHTHELVRQLKAWGYEGQHPTRGGRVAPRGIFIAVNSRLEIARRATSLRPGAQDRRPPCRVHRADSSASRGRDLADRHGMGVEGGCDSDARIRWTSCCLHHVRTGRVQSHRRDLGRDRPLEQTAWVGPRLGLMPICPSCGEDSPGLHARRFPHLRGMVLSLGSVPTPSKV